MGLFLAKLANNLNNRYNPSEDRLVASLMPVGYPGLSGLPDIFAACIDVGEIRSDGAGIVGDFSNGSPLIHIEENMLIPRMTIRQLLWAMAILGGLCWVIALAAQGDIVGTGISISIVAVVLTFVVYAVVYWTLFLIAFLSSRMGHRARGSTPQSPIDGSVAGENEPTEMKVGI